MQTTRCKTFAYVLTTALTIASTAASAQQLVGSEWRPTEIGDTKVPADLEMFVRFGGEGKVEGHGGCNRFFGAYTLLGDEIEIGPLGVTRMACPETIMDYESRFLEALANANRFVRDRIDLSLMDDGGNPVIRLIQSDAD